MFRAWLSGRLGHYASLIWHSPTFATWGGLAVRMSGLCIVVPLVLNRFPVEEASIWFLFLTLQALLALVDFGFAPSFVRAVAYARARSGAESTVSSGRLPAGDTPDVIATMRFVYNWLGVAAFLLIGIAGTLALIVPIARSHDQLAAWGAWGLIVAGSVAIFRNGMYCSYLQGAERIAVYRRWEMVIESLSLLASIAALISGAGLFVVVLIGQLAAILGFAVNRLLAHHYAPAGAWHGPRKNPVVLNNILSVAWRSGLGILMTFGVVHGSGVVVAQIAPPAEVAGYLLALRLMQAIVNFSYVPFSMRIPTLARLYAEKSHTELLAAARNAMCLTNWTLVAGITTVGLLVPRVLEALNSGTAFVDLTVWWILGLAMLVERIGAMHLQLYSTTNHIVWHIANGVSGVLMVLGIPFFYHFFGMLGLPAGILAAYALFYVPFSVRMSYRAFDLRFFEMDFWASMLPLGAVLFFAFLSIGFVSA